MTDLGEKTHGNGDWVLVVSDLNAGQKMISLRVSRWLLLRALYGGSRYDR